jgi:hypothetical protein
MKEPTEDTLKDLIKDPILFVPSVISQSYFRDHDGEVVYLSPKEIDYFYFLLFLYREQLLDQHPNLLIKKDGKHYLNEKVKVKHVLIELKEFQNYDVVKGGKYENFRNFINETLLIDRLPNLSIITNIFLKNKDFDKEAVKVIDHIRWEDEFSLKINFTKKMVKLIIHIENYFMKVDLNNLLKLTSGKAKLLYLYLKDYSNLGRKEISKKELKTLIGGDLLPKRLNKIVQQISSETDIHISYMDNKLKRKKKYIFTIKIKKTKRTEKNKTKQPKKDVEIIDGVWEICKIRLEKQKVLKEKRGDDKIEDEGDYLMTIYENELTTLSDAQKEIYKFIDQYKKEVEYKVSYSPIPYLTIYENEEDDDIPIHINDDFQLITVMGPITFTPEETMKKLDELKENDGKVGSHSYNDLSKEYSKTCLLTTEELRSVGRIK